jgi:DNA-binding SARP family transcriptional activator
MIKAEFLSGFRVRNAAGTVIEVPVLKARALLAFLALNGRRTYRRSVLADLLWDSPSDRHARQSFRRCLHDLRCALGTAADEVLLIDGEKIAVLDEAIDVDVLKFRNLVAVKDYAAAAKMIGDGDLLDDLEVQAEQYDAWLALERRHHCEMIAETLLANAERLAKCNRLDLVKASAERCLKYDPYCEKAHRLLIDHYLRENRPEAARRQYARLMDLASDGLELGATFTATAKFGTRHTSTLHRSFNRPAIYLKSMVSLGPDDVPRGLGDGLLDDLSREISRYRSALPTLHESSADYVIGSSIRTFAGQFKVSLNLVDLSTGGLLWSEAFTGLTSDMLVAQQRIAEMSASRIMTGIARHEIERCKTQNAGRNAYTLWQSGLRQRFSYTKEGNDEAKRLCIEAIKLDPEFTARVRSFVTVCAPPDCVKSPVPESPTNSELVDRLPVPLRV